MSSKGEQLEVILFKDTNKLRMPVFNKGLIKQVLKSYLGNCEQVSSLNNAGAPMTLQALSKTYANNYL